MQLCDVLYDSNPIREAILEMEFHARLAVLHVRRVRLYPSLIDDPDADGEWSNGVKLLEEKS